MKWRDKLQLKYETKLDMRENIVHIYSYSGMVTNGVIYYSKTGDIKITTLARWQKVMVCNANMWGDWL